MATLLARPALSLGAKAASSLWKSHKRSKKKNSGAEAERAGRTANLIKQVGQASKTLIHLNGYDYHWKLAFLIVVMDQAAQALTLGIMWGGFAKVSIKIALTWHTQHISLNGVSTTMGLFEGTANSIMKALRKAIAYVVFCNVLSGWVMFDDSVNPKHAPIHSRRGKIMFPIFLGTSIVMAVLNGTCAYMAIFFQLKGPKLSIPLVDSETGDISTKAAGDVTGFSTKVEPQIGCLLSAGAFGAQVIAAAARFYIILCQGRG